MAVLLGALALGAGLAAQAATGAREADPAPKRPGCRGRIGAQGQGDHARPVPDRGQAYRKWQADPRKVKIIDVRTPEEYLFVGYAPMAWRIPVARQTYEWDAEKQQYPMQLLPDFVERVKTVAHPDDTLLVMCRSGGRSAIAVNLLAQAGYTQVYNIVDGMEGDPVDDLTSVFHGQRVKNGWKNSRRPVDLQAQPRTCGGDDPGRRCDRRRTNPQGATK